MGGSSKSVTVGYRYYLGMHLAICHGPVDALTEIQVGDRQAWKGDLKSSGRLQLNEKELFGGDKREGGVYGSVDAAFGEETQQPNDYLKAVQGDPQPAYRGLFSLILRQVCLAANNPYIKPWAVRVKRCFRAWYPDKAEIHGAANPAHILYECLTNPVWGMGYPAISLDDGGFRAAADALYQEGFGLSLIWSQQSKIEQFVKEVLDHIGGVLTTSPTNGRFVLKLVRANYTQSALPVFGPNTVIELESFQRAAWGETTNELVLIYTHPESFKETSVTVQDLANIQAQGAVVSQTRRYPGITSDVLASRVAMRDLTAVSTPLAKVRLKVNRNGWRLAPGDVFILTWPALGIESLVLRIAAIDGGTLTQGAIHIEAVEDVFGLPAASYTSAQPTGWSDPVPTPAVASHRLLMEAPYWDLVRAMAPAELAYLDASDCYLQALVARPAPGALNYELHSKSHTAPNYQRREQGEFCPTAVLVEPLGAQVESIVMVKDERDLDLVEVGGYAYMNDEVVAVTAIDLSARSLTLLRGVLDTVPTSHEAGGRLWFAEGFQGTDSTDYAAGEKVDARLLTTTGKGTLPLISAPTDSIVMGRRQNRPYPPGNLRINGKAYPKAMSGDLSLTWSHRDRLSQTVDLAPQSRGDIGPEPGVTYHLHVYGENGKLLRTYANLTGTAQRYPLAQEMVDAGMERPNGRLRFELEATRGGLASWRKHNLSIDRAGYGLHYDHYYGGL
ncbi:phage tail protein [Hahella aquimaris]|uniref:phage tail protein n=1 Tax=Hahella sp. HNIBRBA332 TaxID=3015983 RepID=UPI00273BA235|nr:phage tail protein [Hahella sp. HNIBRBA332]WLQ13323.1 phage tail protein [Hahella sp. HNIBRBA332]